MSLRRSVSALLMLLCSAALAPVAAQGPAAPAISGMVIPADDGTTAGLRVTVRAGSHTARAPVDPAGRFSVPLPAGITGDTVEVLAHAAFGTGDYHPARVRATWRSSVEHRLILVPRRWIIRGGRYSGEEVEIDLDRAFAAPCRHCPPFYRRDPADFQTMGVGRLPSWPEEVFPIRVAFDREHSGDAITARDSVAFWRAVTRMEETLGSDLFRPARYSETLPVDFEDPGDVVLVWTDPALGDAGLGTTITAKGEIQYGAVRFRRMSLLSGRDGPHLVAHELLHVLGLGHTCSWHSVMAESSQCMTRRSDEVTPEDVAYFQLRRRVLALQRIHGAASAIDAAMAALH